MNEFDATQIRKVDGALLLIFRELLLRRRATDVAANLGYSPSAISHAITRLRDLFGDPLFTRRAHGLEPTQRAIELGPRVEAVLGLLGEVMSEEAGFNPAASRRRFRIVCADYIATLLAAPLSEVFRRQARRAAFSTRPAYLDRALRAVRRGEAEVALGVFDDIPHGLAAETLCEDEHCVVARRGHPKIDGAIDLATYARIGHVFVGNPDGYLAEEGPMDLKAMRANYGSLPSPDLVRAPAYLTQWESALLVVAESDLLADCPRRLAERYAPRLGLQILDPPYPRFRFTLRAVRRDQVPDPGVDWLMGHIAEALG